MRIAVVLFLAAACSSSNKPPATPPPTGSDTGAGSATADTKCTDPKPAADSVCQQDCGPPVSQGNEPPPAWRWVTPDEAKARQIGGCPICLPPTAQIATPFGDMPVSTLVAGAIVWSKTAAGERIATHVERVGSTTFAAGSHSFVVVRLEDGREIAASARHPDASGRALSEIAVGAIVDGSRVIGIRREPYAGTRTYDLLPASATGVYWADGVVLGSTLR